jgi:hypothetical protein
MKALGVRATQIFDRTSLGALGGVTLPCICTMASAFGSFVRIDVEPGAGRAITKTVAVSAS